MDSFTSSPVSTDPRSEEGFDLLELVLILVRRWRITVFLILLFGLLTALFSFLLKPKYTATVSFLVDQETSSTGIFLFRQTDPTIALLQSKTITQFVLDHVSKENLAEEVSPRLTGDARLLALREHIQGEAIASHTEQGVYSVKITDQSPARAMMIANAYLDALQDLSDHMNFDAATRTRAFYQQQMVDERAALEKSESDLKTHQQSTGMLLPTSQTNLQISQISNLRSQLVALQIQKATISEQATPDNPEMVRLNAQITELQSKINGFQGRISNKNDQDLPSQNLEIGRLERDVSYHQALLASLSTQYERARLQESFGIPRVHVVDRAAPPIPRTFPNRYLLVAVASSAGLFVGILITVLGEVRTRLISNPESSLKLREIRRELRLRKA